jgi:hypothetical protein
MRYEPATWTSTFEACQPGMDALIEYAASIGIGSLGCFNDRAVRGSTSTPSLHREGRAYDAEAGDATDAFVDALVTHYAELGVQQVIWRERSWRCDRTGDKWRPYDGADPHTSHAHIELTRTAAHTLTIEAIRTILEDDMPTAQEIADALLDSSVPTHSYDQGRDEQPTLRTLLGWIHMELQQIRRAP